ncbi:pre-mRNA-splicing regulator WTAP [Diachasma alloeum]|uniref:pre-mRNA-splicing regulator WTAP n=1 Tax=Diachasma alloeum TaxID=454923 RepID=UPI0007384C64|nr:pre-mRNA-splicing regulator WTAP [Diachasma alloeum]
MAEEGVEVKQVGPSSPRSPHTSVQKPPSPRSPRHARRIKLTDQQLETTTKEELAAKWREQDLYIECLEAQSAAQEGELASLRESEDKYRQQYGEASHREKILVRRLASKEQELQEYVNQIAAMKAAQSPSASSLRSTLLDPAVNILIQRLRQELITTKAKLEDTQNELSAWKFTPDSNTGKRLMAKCRLLYQENEELGRMIASGRIAKLEGELALQKSFSEEVKKSQSELDEFLQDLDEDVEGMQSTIYFLQQELRKARESVTLLQQENASLKSTSDQNLSNGLSPHTPPLKKEDNDDDDVKSEINNMKLDNDTSGGCKIGARTPPLMDDKTTVEKLDTNIDNNDDSSSDSAALIIKVDNEELTDREYDDDDDKMKKKICRTKCGNTNANANGDEIKTRCRDRTKRDNCDDNESDDDRVKIKKKKKSDNSMDFNDADDDAIVITNGETLQSDPE